MKNVTYASGMMQATEPVLVCPYNKAHSILQSRMQYHLAKCRMQYPESEKEQCPFNSTHIVYKSEMKFHEQNCPNRYVIDSFFCAVGNTKPPVDDVSVNTPREALQQYDECWDDEPAVSVLDVVKETVKDKKVMVNLIGAPRAERKSYRMQERIRYQQISNAEEKKEQIEKKNGGSLDKPDGLPPPGNVVASSSTNMTRTDNSSVSSDLSVGVNAAKDSKEFEIVKYNKKGKKNKQNQIVKIRPLQISNDEQIMSQLTKLKLDRNEGGTDVGPQTQLPKIAANYRTPVTKVSANAWEKPLNMGAGGGRVCISASPDDDFPSLPVSGRGRGAAAKNN